MKDVCHDCILQRYLLKSAKHIMPDTTGQWDVVIAKPYSPGNPEEDAELTRIVNRECFLNTMFSGVIQEVITYRNGTKITVIEPRLAVRSIHCQLLK